jgi:hypothetical protein
VAVPFTMEVNDMPMYVRHGNPPRAMQDVFDDTFECLTREGRATSLDVTVHAHVFGRPSGAWVYDRILERVTQDSRVWVATRSQIADHLLDGSP